MSVYDADFANITLHALAPQKRMPNNIAVLGIFASDFQYLHDSIFGVYMNGFAGSAWSAGTYTIGQQVWYIDNCVYEVLVASTTNPPSSNDWGKILNNRIGAVERQNYTGSKLILEYGLNRWFNTTFRSPPSVPDIYITNLNNTNNWFCIGLPGDNTSTIAATAINSSFGVGVTYSVPNANDFSINVPIAVYNALASNNADRTAIFRAFADKYVISGITYSVLTY